MKMTIGAAMAAALMLAIPASHGQTVENALDTAGETASDAMDTVAEATSDGLNAANEALGYEDSGRRETSSQELGTQEAERSVSAANDQVEQNLDSADDAMPRRSEKPVTSDADIKVQSNDQNKPQWDERSDRAPQRRFTEQQRTAPWRFVQRDGVWWYRTPMNTWMVQRGGQWQPFGRTAGYSGAAQQAQYSYESQPGAMQYDNQYQSAQATYEQGQQPQFAGEQAQHAGQQTSYEGERAHSGQHPKVGTTEWMCIDGRMRKVTVVAVHPVSMNSNSDSYESDSMGYEEKAPNAPTLAPAPGGQNGLAPPPVPQPGAQPNATDRDVPDAPSQEQLKQQSATAQSRSASKPVVSEIEEPSDEQPLKKMNEDQEAKDDDASDDRPSLDDDARNE